MRREGALVLLAALAACSRGERAGEAVVRQNVAEADGRIRCALGGARDFAPNCSREVTKGPSGETWIIRHPDGGFRRFVLVDKGMRIATADGAEEVQADRVGANLEVRVADNRYLFPAAPAAPAAASDAPAS